MPSDPTIAFNIKSTLVCEISINPSKPDKISISSFFNSSKRIASFILSMIQIFYGWNSFTCAMIS